MSEIRHGPSGYNHHGCRCDVCVEENRTYNREAKRVWRMRRRNATKLRPPDVPVDTKRFVVRSVTGFPINDTVLPNTSARRTLYAVHDRMDCWRVVYEPSKKVNNPLALCEREARRLNSLPLGKVQEPAA